MFNMCRLLTDRKCNFVQGWGVSPERTHSSLVPWSQNSWTWARPRDRNFSTMDCSLAVLALSSSRISLLTWQINDTCVKPGRKMSELRKTLINFNLLSPSCSAALLWTVGSEGFRFPCPHETTGFYYSFPSSPPRSHMLKVLPSVRRRLEWWRWRRSVVEKLSAVWRVRIHQVVGCWFGLQPFSWLLSAGLQPLMQTRSSAII